MLIRCEITKRNEFEIESGTHRYNSLVVVLKGEFLYTAENKTKTVRPFEAVLFKKGVPFVKKVISPIEFIIVSFHHFSFVCDCFLEYRDKDRVKNTIRHLITAIEEDSADTVKEHFANDILLMAQKGKTENTMLPAYSYITENYSEKLSLKDLAQINCCSVQTLINRFKKHTGKTPVKYLTELRVKKAKEYLLNTDLTIGEISELLGFDNVYYFSNVFKNATGMAPLKFRNFNKI
ncbi:MAG: helix-turn-helix transcriptional regulator [Clostridia bacterium]|nr:helix-turn-helix transcriptional regulator [Clostridia bacterium]